MCHFVQVPVSQNFVLWELPIQEPDTEHTCSGLGLRVTSEGKVVDVEHCSRCFPNLTIAPGTQLCLPENIPSWKEAAHRVDGFSSMVTPTEVLGSLLQSRSAA
ncbi:MAG: hypothetical protein A3B74_00740 [Candidatus Kerfeldbacteria bacterium RIFCSPHIGHO2_02_FULL_42_14]|uniref:Uncharacterized protein n=1 Tax=Candidatus Kerfeldbacteria bacterium RIFCSPHIGHO2_02_FULL_42_14 TaxID=1798540 RepID=A0A1G2AS84_9BACT|nr:MAG: hypothetical protein A3B74_00740 [Candidatus Kerfeldbacteria bacterium RIFCSPHIGHO2_02_FULL_42_14]OGY81884.1 MAG: hypothetical protein A3E60_00820 [Candidatus Kerfeldbacteria bacterium RIFCSPHIGHO2_12_FULL_42_13]OGY83481.1 MAG: hypothetical protein A3I91_02435 [Candidatus Kerfeldbacteria bacterium RIFCSPLOWO2_02_FULL_42_19]OGY86993.1 MAG: hypothetical protein A3G01_01775 [Candidatus Kerfeldbacteria bacterium RIFCSPLOWO2_12_FULL_43_9]